MVASDGQLGDLEERGREEEDPFSGSETQRLISAIEEAAKHLNSLSVTFLFLVVYVLVTLGSIDDVALLVGRAVKLPLLSVDVPLRLFLLATPWFVFSLHAHALMQLGRLRTRLCSLVHETRSAQASRSTTQQRIRSEWFFPFPPIEIFLASRPIWRTPFLQERYLPRAVIFVLYVAVYAFLPLGTQVFVLYKALLYHSTDLVAMNFVAVAAGLAVVAFKFPLRPCTGLEEREWWLQKTLFLIFVGGYLILLPIFCQLGDGEGCPSGGFHRHLNVTGEDLASRFEGRLQLRGRQLHCVVLTGVNLKGADLRGADLTQADLREADLREALLLPTDISYSRWQALEDPDLEEELLTRRREKNNAVTLLDGARLTKANLSGSQLAFASMRSTVLTDAVLGLADLTGVDALDADFRRAHLEGARLIGAQLDGARFDRAYLTGSTLRLAQAVGASFLGAHMEFADLTGSLLTGASLVDVEAQKASFEGMEGSFVDIRGGKLDGSEGLKVTGSVLSHARLSSARVNLRDSDIRELRLDDSAADPCALRNRRLEDIKPVYGELPGWNRWVARMNCGAVDTSPGYLPTAGRGTRLEICGRQLLWEAGGGELPVDPSGRCAPVEKKQFYRKLADAIISQLGTEETLSPSIRKALLNMACGNEVPRLRELEQAFREPPRQSDLAKAISRFQQNGNKISCLVLLGSDVEDS